MQLIPREKRKFTLVEILVVIAIIAIIAGVGIPKFSKYRDAAFAGQRRANVQAVITAIDSIQIIADKSNADMASISAESGIFEGTTLMSTEIYKYIKGGQASLIVEGEAMILPPLCDTEDLFKAVGSPDKLIDWKPYSQAMINGKPETYWHGYLGRKDQ
ncbi:MAG: prepilin-type N-terminal cleavage/methylation domain-containing protein [Lentisphaeraceae bacterium]|nr:prepilin-type N-terminal cleavage/methylation domain-containing protein [Lentisphaeraceae bacterium]